MSGPAQPVFCIVDTESCYELNIHIKYRGMIVVVYTRCARYTRCVAEVSDIGARCIILPSTVAHKQGQESEKIVKKIPLMVTDKKTQ